MNEYDKNRRLEAKIGEIYKISMHCIELPLKGTCDVAMTENIVVAVDTWVRIAETTRNSKYPRYTFIGDVSINLSTSHEIRRSISTIT